MSDENPHGLGPFDEQAILLDQLNQSVQQARDTVERGRLATVELIDNAELAAEAKQVAADKANRQRNRNTLFTAVVIAAVALLISGIYSWRTGNIADDALAASAKANDAIAANEADREARTQGSCEAAREAAVRSNDKDRAHIADIVADLNLLAPLTAAATTEEGIALGQAYLARKNEIVLDIIDNQDRIRICTTSAIAAFFESGGVEGIEPPQVAAPQPDPLVLPDLEGDG